MNLKEKSEKSSIRFVGRYEREYPAVLNEIPKAPGGLYVYGRLPDSTRPAVAIVGARMCSAYGKRQAFHFAKVLSQCGVQIISGLAYGIDAYAHKGALAAQAQTFAVMGCGADICYPKRNIDIYREIPDKGGGILSEFPNQTEPSAWHFPIRNRIISGLADLILVIEAKKKSGSLITADYALEQGRTVFALPGRVDEPLSEGCNDLIYQGAGIAYSVSAVLDELQTLKNKKTGRIYGAFNIEETEKQDEEAFTVRKLSEAEQAVFTVLGNEELGMQELIERTGFSVPHLSITLLSLQQKDIIREVGHSRFGRIF